MILAQRQIHGRNYTLALKTALRLKSYELELDPKRVYSIIALSAYCCGHYAEFSRATMKLVALPGIKPETKAKYEFLALSVFTKNAPNPPPNMKRMNCPSCNEQITEYDTHC